MDLIIVPIRGLTTEFFCFGLTQAEVLVGSDVFKDEMTPKEHIRFIKGIDIDVVEKELTLPSASIKIDRPNELNNAIDGIYFGWASLDNVNVHPMIAILTTTPEYDSDTFKTKRGDNVIYYRTGNNKRTLNVYLFGEFNDFYGEKINLIAVSHIRNNKRYKNVFDYESILKDDIIYAKEKLASGEYDSYKQVVKFRPNSTTEVADIFYVKPDGIELQAGQNNRSSQNRNITNKKVNKRRLARVR